MDLRLKEETVQILIDEIRKGYNIPFYFENDSIRKSINEADYYLNSCVQEDIDYDEDLTARELLKNRVLYSFHNRLDDFRENYSDMILEWQISKINPVFGDEDEA